jgi:hypothetical protein
MKQQTKLTFVVDNSGFSANPPTRKVDFHNQRLARVIISGSFDYIFAELDRLEALENKI